MVVALAPFAIVLGVIATIALVAGSLWRNVTAPLIPLAETYRLSLERAGIRASGETIIIAICGAAAALWLAVVVLFHPAPLIGALYFPICFFAASLGAKSWIERRIRTRLRAFGEQLELVLRLMASGLRAGLGLRQALVLVVDELDDPARDEFRRVLGQATIGVSPYDALDALAARMPSDETQMMVRAIRVQSQTGGNLAKVLEHLAQTIRERRRVTRKMRALTAEGRMTAWVVGLLPVLVGAFIITFNAGMRHGLLFTGLGHGVLALIAVLEGMGAFMLRRILRFDI